VYVAPPLAVESCVHVDVCTLSRFVNAVAHSVPVVALGFALNDVVRPRKVTLTVPDSVPTDAAVVIVILRFSWLIVSGSSPFGHITREQSAPKYPASHLHPEVESLSQFV